MDDFGDAKFFFKIGASALFSFAIFLTQSEKSPTSLSVSVGWGYDKLYSVGVP